MKAWLFRIAFILSLLAAVLVWTWWVWREFFSAGWYALNRTV